MLEATLCQMIKWPVMTDNHIESPRIGWFKWLNVNYALSEFKNMF